MDELLEGLKVAAANGCGHSDTILESPLRLAFLNSAGSVARYLMTNTTVLVKSIEPFLAWEPRSQELLQMLIDKGWSINKHDKDIGDGPGGSLLHYVCADVSLVSWALDNGVRPNNSMPTDPYRCPPLLDTVARRGSEASFKLLASKGARRGFRILHSAVDAAFDSSEPRLEMVEYLVDNLNLDVNALDAPLPNRCPTLLYSKMVWQRQREHRSLLVGMRC